MDSSAITPELLEQSDYRLELKDLTVDFGATRALDALSFAVRPGEIIGLIGHNGAGKSTVFNVVSGAISRSDGMVSVDGVKVDSRTDPMAMAHLGVTVIHQEPALAPNLSVIDNLCLGQSKLPRKRRVAAARDALARVGAEVDLRRRVDTLSLGQRQLIDLARGLIRGDIKILLLDEPTAALGQAETIALHKLIRDLAASGVTVVYVSHRLPDILDVCQRILVLTSGRLKVDRPAAEFDGASLSLALAPDQKSSDFREQEGAASDIVNFSAPWNAIECRAGEVVGLFGMAAGEQFELIESAFGLNRRFSFSLGGEPVTVGSPSSAISKGVFLVPADREQDGLISGNSAIDTIFLPWYRFGRNRGFWIGKNSGRAEYDHARGQLDILGPGRLAPIDEFSGGNRQKHLIARWMFPRKPRLLLLAQPTQGVDVGARIDIANAVRALAAEGVMVVVASAESDEISLLCDRAYVLYEGATQPVTRSPEFGSDLLSTLLEMSTLRTHEKVLEK